MTTSYDPSQSQEPSYDALVSSVQAMVNTSSEDDFIKEFKTHRAMLNSEGGVLYFEHSALVLKHVMKNGWIDGAKHFMQWAQKSKDRLLWQEGLKASTSIEMMDVFLDHAPALTANWMGRMVYEMPSKMFAHCFAKFMDRGPQYETARSDEEIAQVLDALVRSNSADHVEAALPHLDEAEAITILHWAVKRNRCGMIDVLYTVARADFVFEDIQSAGHVETEQHKNGINYLNVLWQRSQDHQELIDEMQELGTSHKRPLKL